MSNILIINSGSTSIKYKLFDENENEIKGGEFAGVDNHEKAIKNILREAGEWANIAAVGHRVVHGGDAFSSPVLVDEKVMEKLEAFNCLAPLHNPYNLAGIKAVKNYLPEIKQIAVFDTAFYADLPEVAREYALPEEIREKYKIRRFGFHGISHRFAMEEAARELGKPVDKIHPMKSRLSGGSQSEFYGVNLISCHLGGGWSVTAVKNGKAIDTSMGWTPMEGLIMMTRAGDLDPGIVIELIKRSPSYLGDEKCEEVYDLLNHKSGIKGLAGGINDYQKLLRELTLGNKKAKLAFDSAIYRLSKYIAAYWAVLGGKVDAVVFTGAIGAGNPITRNEVMRKLKCLGDIPALAVKTNEELAIMREVKNIIQIYK